MESWEARSDFQLSTPGEIRLKRPGFGWRRAIAERRVWSDGVVVNPPAFGQDLHLFERVEDLAVEELSRNFGLKLSQYPFSHGLPGSM